MLDNVSTRGKQMRTQPEDMPLGSRDEELPPNFTAAERRAYVWLWDCGIRPWLVDLVTKEVTTPEAKWPGLVEFAAHVRIAEVNEPKVEGYEQ